MGKPKRIAFELIPPGSVPQPEPYAIMHDLVRNHHPHLLDARIAIAWRRGWSPDVDGRMILGRCIRATDLQRELAVYDFVILLNKEIWDDREFSLAKKRALVDHELCHAERAEDDEGPRKDARGRQVWRIRKHDIEEFAAIVERHGCYKRDLERFAEVIQRRRKSPLFTQAEEIQTSGSGRLEAPVNPAAKADVLDAADRLTAHVRSGELTSMTISTEGMEPVVLDQAAAERIHAAAERSRRA